MGLRWTGQIQVLVGTSCIMHSMALSGLEGSRGDPEVPMVTALCQRPLDVTRHARPCRLAVVSWATRQPVWVLCSPLWVEACTGGPCHW